MAEYDDFVERLKLLTELARLWQTQGQEPDPVLQYLEAERKRREEEGRRQQSIQLGYGTPTRTTSGTPAQSGPSGFDRTMQVLGAANTISEAATGEGLGSLLAGAAK